MQIGVLWTCTSKHWRWFQDDSFNKTSAPSSPHKLPIFSFVSNFFSYFYKLKCQSVYFLKKNNFFCFVNNFWPTFSEVSNFVDTLFKVTVIINFNNFLTKGYSKVTNTTPIPQTLYKLTSLTCNHLGPRKKLYFLKHKSSNLGNKPFMAP